MDLAGRWFVWEREAAAYLGVVLGVFDDLRGHPKWGPDKCGAFGHCIRQLTGNTKVGELDFALTGQQNIRSCETKTRRKKQERSSSKSNFVKRARAQGLAKKNKQLFVIKLKRRGKRTINLPPNL